MKNFKHPTDLISGLRCDIIRIVIRKIALLYWKMHISDFPRTFWFQINTINHQENPNWQLIGFHNTKQVSKIASYAKFSHITCEREKIWSMNQKKNDHYICRTSVLPSAAFTCPLYLHKHGGIGESTGYTKCSSEERL